MRYMILVSISKQEESTLPTKSTLERADRIEHSRVTPTQSAALDKYAEMGAECFIVIGFDMRVFFRVPWAIFRDMKTRWGRKYITPNDLGEYALTIGRFGQMLILG